MPIYKSKFYPQLRTTDCQPTGIIQVHYILVTSTPTIYILKNQDKTPLSKTQMLHVRYIYLHLVDLYA